RPPSAKQYDEDDLMPYEILDALAAEFIGNRRSIADAVSVVLGMRLPSGRTVLEEHGAGRMAVWADRFARRHAANQWKRERLAPAFHVDVEDLDPRAWCRWP